MNSILSYAPCQLCLESLSALYRVCCCMNVVAFVVVIKNVRLICCKNFRFELLALNGSLKVSWFLIARRWCRTLGRNSKLKLWKKEFPLFICFALSRKRLKCGGRGEYFLRVLLAIASGAVKWNKWMVTLMSVRWLMM